MHANKIIDYKGVLAVFKLKPRHECELEVKT